MTQQRIAIAIAALTTLALGLGATALYVLFGPTQVVVVNAASKPIRDVRIGGRRFEVEIPKLGAGQRSCHTVDVAGESSIRLEGDLDDRAIDSGEIGYVEGAGGYRVELVISEAGSVEFRYDFRRLAPALLFRRGANGPWHESRASPRHGPLDGVRGARRESREGTPMNRLSPEECRIFLSEGSRTGKLATVRRDGRPHVAPIWFVLDGDAAVFMTHEDTLKAKSLRREPRAMISVDDERFPYAFVLVEGTVSFERPSAEALLPWSLRIAARYVPEERVEATGRRNAVEGELLARLSIERLTGMSDVAS